MPRVENDLLVARLGEFECGIQVGNIVNLLGLLGHIAAFLRRSVLCVSYANEATKQKPHGEKEGTASLHILGQRPKLSDPAHGTQ